ncbi:MAG TPA: hypothetical protein VMG37_22520 [Solirubrobacteraceae bacterium]|nr:hypothetical protein [Solirubrobacteraceae bacterium]
MLLRIRVAVASVLAAALLAGCGFDVQEPDLFLVTRTGAHGQKLSLLVNDGGTISCNGGKPKNLPDPLLLQARDLATSLNTDVNSKLRFPSSARSVYSYTVKVQNGTLSFPDTAALSRKELSDLELFVVQAAQNPCGLTA